VCAAGMNGAETSASRGEEPEAWVESGEWRVESGEWRVAAQVGVSDCRHPRSKVRVDRSAEMLIHRAPGGSAQFLRSHFGHAHHGRSLRCHEREPTAGRSHRVWPCCSSSGASRTGSTWIRRARARGVPRLRRSGGWLVCESCDHHRLVPFSCKGRGFCPACGGRRMTTSARRGFSGDEPTDEDPDDAQAPNQPPDTAVPTDPAHWHPLDGVR
jgi:hypothetical protein